MIAWDVTFLMVNLASLIGLLLLLRSPPCLMQAFTIGTFALAFFVYCAANVIELAGWTGTYEVRSLGHAILKLGVVLYVFRLFYDAVIWQKFSRRSRS